MVFRADLPLPFWWSLLRGAGGQFRRLGFITPAITGVFLLLDRRIFQAHWGVWCCYHFDALGGAVVFFGVIVFDLGVTIAIGEIALALTGSLLSLGMLLLILARFRRPMPGLEMPVEPDSTFCFPRSSLPVSKPRAGPQIETPSGGDSWFQNAQRPQLLN